MIYSLHGIVQELTPTFAIINVAGLGYGVGISLQTSNQMSLNKEIFLYTQQIIREDAHLLYGFSTVAEKEMFNLLISVTGVGAVSALILLSSISLEEIAKSIQSGNQIILQKVKGIGTKTAARIIVDLQDKVQKFSVDELQDHPFADTKIKEEALSALEVLGISKRMSEKLADKILKQDSNITVEDLIKQILKNI